MYITGYTLKLFRTRLGFRSAGYGRQTDGCQKWSLEDWCPSI